MTGGEGADTFVLGDETGVFYNQNGFLDCAIIKDFNDTEGDQIQLAGLVGDYTLNTGTNTFGDDFTEIFQGDPADGELIALVEGVQLDSNNLVFV